MATLGEKIRTLRKEKKLTQSELAGTVLTKSMLSQIENGKATPSIKTLHYLADKLGCDASFLLEEENEYTTLVQKMEQYIQEMRFKDVYETLHPIVHNVLPSTLNAARLYKQYAKVATYTGNYDVHAYTEKAIIIFEKYALYRESTETKLISYYSLFRHKEYNECLQLIHSIRDEYKEKHLEMDLIMQIELFWYEAIILLALGNYEGCKDILLQTLHFSKKNQVYYKMDEFYRLLSYQAIFVKDTEGYLHNLEKAKQFAIFTENTLSLTTLHLLQAYFHNTITKQYEIALSYVETYGKELITKLESEKNGFYYLEKGKALYGLKRYHEALHELDQVTIPTYTHHPIDQALLTTAGSFRALCYMHLKDKEQALYEAKQAHTAIQDYHAPMFSSFTEETLQMIQKL
ncbi:MULTISPECIES: helix-turn-helix domain-containing protein [unclassified Bacillus (in: firmicutes)]|uniref:helix-turn-helix domain-containing protein n=1 Tax=unclassified Bacillus (in: firmicutes) TaxID=185979 RepID=UPI0008E68357|nr:MULTISPECIES: helix-turn-helix transcriptional regulator [unclassified Bacillus (in: firmicutes)]SFI10601.1 DNA-binding transcriptional regulator, XRE-family HTH domain [Bacillus sp. 71mf]SFS76304.1 DNA-binding transcriptional regulator, XRE-family HTH domain [Bacillus sp. 103mf]